MWRYTSDKFRWWIQGRCWIFPKKVSCLFCHWRRYLSNSKLFCNVTKLYLIILILIIQFNPSECTHRDHESHTHYCDLVEGDVNGRGGFSTTYGINRRSLDLPFFDITRCLPFDIMHTLFEGVSPLLLNQLFDYLVSNHFVTLEEINSEMKQMCSGYSEVDTIPSP